MGELLAEGDELVGVVGFTMNTVETTDGDEHETEVTGIESVTALVKAADGDISTVELTESDRVEYDDRRERYGVAHVGVVYEGNIYGEGPVDVFRAEVEPATSEWWVRPLGTLDNWEK